MNLNKPVFLTSSNNEAIEQKKVLDCLLYTSDAADDYSV